MGGVIFPPKKYIEMYGRNNSKKTRTGGVGFKNGSAFVNDGSPTGKAISSMRDALAEETKCGCGIRCSDSYSYMTLKDFNSTTGQYEYKAVYLVDGDWNIDTIANAEVEMDGYKALRG